MVNASVLQLLLSYIASGHTPKQAMDTLLHAGIPEEVAQATLMAYQQKVAQVSQMSEPGSMVSEDHDGWYAGPSPSSVYWPKLHAYLREEKGWPEHVLSSLDESSTRIVSLLHPPYASEFSTRGLVLGHVQSGKTSNFTAVIAKAVDAGYKFVIVLSGLHNGLRQQTQERLNAELVSLNAHLWQPLTDVQSDFRRPAGNPTAFFTDHSAQKVLCVIKKNGPRLRALLRWLRKADRAVLANCPMLMIDDEADQASVDTKGTEDPSAINRLIRDILGVFKKGAYVAYTATPFANIVSDPSQADLLYPKDFIVDLPRPDGYFGAERMFGTEPVDQESEGQSDGPPMIRIVPREEVSQVKPPSRDARERFEPDLTPSLGSALRWFWLSCAVRLARGHASAHMSMLVHTTLYNDVQQRFEGLLHGAIQEARRQWSADSEGLKGELSDLFARETAKISAGSCGEVPVPFEEAWAHLGEVLRRVKVTIDNSKSQKRLVYPPGGSIQIVVGGNTLSRGLTLEGLCVSWFVRTSTMYDTLLQMGRWFGYRQGYSDLPRIWMTWELLDYFQHLARVELEIRQDIARYEQEGLTPRLFAPRIRTHSTLAITSPLKMRYAVDAEMSFDGQTKQTTYFKHEDRAWLRQNLLAARDLLRAADTLHPPELIWDRHALWRGVGATDVLSFLDRYQICENHADMSAHLLRQYIRAQNGQGELLSWNIGVVSRKGDPAGTLPGLLPGGQAVNLLIRARFGQTENANLKAIMSQTDRAIDFGLPQPPSPERAREDGAKSIADWATLRRGKAGSPADSATGTNTPLLLLYPISKDSDTTRPSDHRGPLSAVDHVVGLALVFPGAQRLTPQGYVTADLSRMEEGREELEYTPEDEEAE